MLLILLTFLFLYSCDLFSPSYNITYDSNGATAGVAPVDPSGYKQGKSITVMPSGTLVRDGYSFTGWNTLADGTGTSYLASATFSMGSADVTLYAKWALIPTYTVTYDGNGATGGTLPTDSSSYQAGSIVTVRNSGTIVRSHYSFAAWNTLADGSGTSYTPAATFAMGSTNVTLYAKWTAEPTYTVTYDGNGSTGGTVPTDSSSYWTGNTVTVQSNGTMVRSHYSFTGWNTLASGTGTSYLPAATFTMSSANVTLYAKWTASEAYTALTSDVAVDISNYNYSPRIYSMVTVMPGTSAQGNSAPVASYSGTLAVSTGAASIANPIMCNSASPSRVSSSVYKSGQIKRDGFMREAEERILARGTRQVSRATSKRLKAAPASISVGTAWNNVFVYDTNDVLKSIDTTCRYVSDHAYFFVDNRNITAMESYLSGYGTSFDGIYLTDRVKFGNENDVDSNSKTIIVFSQELSGGLLGYFYPADKYPNSYYSDSNEGDIFYMTTTSSYQGETINGTLAHEFQHMIYFDQHYNRNVLSTYSWLNEALSQAAEYYNNYLDNHNAWLTSFLDTDWPGLSLTYWTSSNYGYGAIFIRYLIEQYGDTAIKNMCSTDKIGIAAVEAATGASFSTIFNNFTRALAMSNTGDSSDSRYNFSTLNLRTLQSSGRGGLLQSATVISPGWSYTIGIYAYEITFNRCEGTFGTFRLSGTNFSGTAFGLTY